MALLEHITITCPYCGESFETVVDTSGGDQDYVEDCAVCCRPIRLLLRVDFNGELIRVEVNRDDQ